MQNNGNSGPLFSIIIPTFNREKLIAACLDSVREQIWTDYEVIIIDGGSTDKTVEIANSYKTFFGEHKIKVFSEADKGIYDAMNKGIAKASGQWLYFLGSDDSLFDQHILSQVAGVILSGEKQFDAIYGKVQLQPQNVQYGEQFDLSNISNRVNICHQAIFYHKTVFSRLGNYSEHYKVAADWEFNLRLFLNKKFKVNYIDRVIANYSNYGFSSANSDILFYDDYDKLIRTNGYKYLPLKVLKFYCPSNWVFLKLLFRRFVL